MNVKLFGIFTLLVLLCTFMAVMTAEPWYDLSDSTFLQPNNIENLLRRTAMYGILGIGVAFVIISSGIDLSVGSVVCLSGCLLAIFLHVDYRAFQGDEIFRVNAAARIIMLEGDVSTYEPGDRIRYSGGRRARSGVFTIANVESLDLTMLDGEPSLDMTASSIEFKRITLITVEESITGDDRYGQIAAVFPIASFDSGNPQAEPPALPTILMEGAHHDLHRRDQIVLVHPTSGLNQLSVEAAEVQGDQTKVTLQDGLGSSFSTTWLAVPMERRQRLPIAGALGAVLGIALFLGLIHGLLVTRVKLQPFVVTLCGLLIYRGLSRWMVSDQPVGFGNEFENTLSPLGSGKFIIYESESAVFGVPYPFFILVITALLAAVFLNKTIWGRYLLALGRNEEAARYSGISTGRVTMMAYVISTVLAATGGILFALDSNSISPSSFGNFFELYAIAAAVLGGCSLRGGEGSILGVIIGTAVMQILYNLIVLMKISGTLEFAIIGLVILFGVVMDELVKRIAARRRAIAQARNAD